MCVNVGFNSGLWFWPNFDTPQLGFDSGIVVNISLRSLVLSEVRCVN